MAFNELHKRRMFEMYLRSGQHINGEWVYSTRDAFEDFREEFPDIVVHFDSFNRTVHYIAKVFRETGSVNRKEGSGRPTVRTDVNIETVRQIIEDQPQTSIRHLQQQADLSYGTCQRILKKDLHCHPYRLQAFHELLPNDRPQRLQFCQWSMNNFINNEDVFEKSFFTDEAWFHLSGYVNSQNMRMWSTRNPHFFTETPLHPRKIGVWAAISQRRLVGPFFFGGRLTSLRYRQELLTPFINSLMDDELAEGYFQQDGARIHTTRDALNFLMEFFEDRIISLNMPIIWPPRSCDLTPCDYFLWPYIKNSIFSTPVVDMQDLEQRIINKFEEINNSPDMLQNVFRSFRNRITLCLNEDGGHVAHLV